MRNSGYGALRVPYLEEQRRIRLVLVAHSEVPEALRKAKKFFRRVASSPGRSCLRCFKH